MYKVRLVLVLLLVGSESGVRFPSQSVSVPISIAYSFDVHLKSALWPGNWNNKPQLWHILHLILYFFLGLCILIQWSIGAPLASNL